MPSSVGSSLFIFAAIMAVLNPAAAVVIAGFALGWELFLFWKSGTE